MLETLQKMAATQQAACEAWLAYQVWLAAATSSVCLAALGKRTRLVHKGSAIVLQIRG